MITPDIRAGWQEADALRKQRDDLLDALRQCMFALSTIQGAQALSAYWIARDAIARSKP